MCHHNAAVAAELGRLELAGIWQLAAQARPQPCHPHQVAVAAGEVGEESEAGPWASCPMGRPLLASLLQHHLECRDFQTVALLVCAFTHQTKTKALSPATSPPAALPLHTRDKFWFLKVEW